jgi:hypothetical protein
MQQQRPAVAKKKRHDVVFFVKREDCVAGCHAQQQRPAVAKKKRHDVVFFVKTVTLEGPGRRG